MFKGFLEKFKECVKKVSGVFSGTFKLFQMCFKFVCLIINSVSWVLQVCFNNGLRKLQGCLKSASKVLKRQFPKCFNYVSRFFR